MHTAPPSPTPTSPNSPPSPPERSSDSTCSASASHTDTPSRTPPPDCPSTSHSTSPPLASPGTPPRPATGNPVVTPAPRRRRPTGVDQAGRVDRTETRRRLVSNRRRPRSHASAPSCRCTPHHHHQPPSSPHSQPSPPERSSDSTYSASASHTDTPSRTPPPDCPSTSHSTSPPLASPATPPRPATGNPSSPQHRADRGWRTAVDRGGRIGSGGGASTEASERGRERRAKSRPARQGCGRHVESEPFDRIHLGVGVTHASADPARITRERHQSVTIVTFRRFGHCGRPCGVSTGELRR